MTICASKKECPVCDSNCVRFGSENLNREEIEGKRVLEVGSYDVNGSLRSGVMKHNPSEYVGVDIERGPGVDVVCGSDAIVKLFGKESFDVVISTCVLEHVVSCKPSISAMKNVCKTGGIIILIVPSVWPLHNHPVDCWRFSKKDIAAIFEDFDILILDEKPTFHGAKIGDLVYLKARKPEGFIEKDITDCKIYHIQSGKRA